MATAGENPELGNIKLEVDKTIAEAQDKLKRKPDRASSPSLMNGHASGSFNATGNSGEHSATLSKWETVQHIADWCTCE